MRVTVHYMAQIKRAAGCASEEIETPDGADLRQALRTVASRHGDSFRAMLLDEGQEPRKSLLYFVGDDHADATRKLRDGDAITILAPMAGG